MGCAELLATLAAILTSPCPAAQPARKVGSNERHQGTERALLPPDRIYPEQNEA